MYGNGMNIAKSFGFQLKKKTNEYQLFKNLPRNYEVKVLINNVVLRDLEDYYVLE